MATNETYLYRLLRFDMLNLLVRIHRFRRLNLPHRLLGLRLGSLLPLYLRMGRLGNMLLVSMARRLFRRKSEFVFVSCFLSIALHLVDLGLEGLERGVR